LQDIRTLDKMKQTAIASPETFAGEVAAGRLQRPRGQGVLNLDPSPNEDIREQETVVSYKQAPIRSGDVEFETIPQPQNVVRCPPINWAKYHVVGAPLDRMHEEQRRNPTPGDPKRDETYPAQRGPDHMLAAPYRPFVDVLEGLSRTRSSGKKG
jgi:hypothetical protein